MTYAAAEEGMPQYVQNIRRSLKDTFSLVCQQLDAAHQCQKCAVDKASTGDSLHVFQLGDIVWLYVPAIKSGLSKNLSSLWRGPYTVLDKVTNVNYKVQLIGSTKCQIVHANRLKLCYGHPEPELHQISGNERNAGHSRSSQPDDASGHMILEEENEEEAPVH